MGTEVSENNQMSHTSSMNHTTSIRSSICSSISSNISSSISSSSSSSSRNHPHNNHKTGRGLGRTRTCSSLRVATFVALSCFLSLVLSVEAKAKKTQVCDEKCQRRAKAGEVVIVSLVLVIALISGLGCLCSLGTPTKFQAPKRARTA